MIWPLTDNAVPIWVKAAPDDGGGTGGGDAGGDAGGGDAGGGDAGGGDGGGAGDAGGGDAGGAGDAGGGAGGGDHWMTGMPDGSFNERDANVLKRFGDVGALAKGYLNAFNLVGRDKIPMPTNEDEWKEVYDRLGRPEGADGYTLTVGDDLPAEFKETMSKNMDWFKGAAHELGLNTTQASALYDKYTRFVYGQAQNQNEAIKQEMDSARDTLKTELGDAYDGKMTLANRAISEVGGEELIGLFERTGMGRNPVVVKAFIKLGEMMGEEMGLDSGGDNRESNSDLDGQIADIQADPAYLDKAAPQHKVLVEKMAKLMQRRHPEPKTAPGTIRLF